MPVCPDSRRIHFRLLFQKRDGAAGGHQHEKPIAVPRRLDRIEREFIWRERACEMVHLVALRRMRGVEFAPVGLGAVVGSLRPTEVQFVAAPVDGDAGVAAPGVSHHAVERRRLSAAVDVEQGGEFRCALWKRVERGHARRRSLEDANLVADQPAPHAVLLPRLEDFAVKRRGPVEFPKPGPEFSDGLRDVGCLGKRFDKGQRERCRSGGTKKAAAGDGRGFHDRTGFEWETYPFHAVTGMPCWTESSPRRTSARRDRSHR